MGRRPGEYLAGTRRTAAPRSDRSPQAERRAGATAPHKSRMAPTVAAHDVADKHQAAGNIRLRPHPCVISPCLVLNARLTSGHEETRIGPRQARKIKLARQSASLGLPGCHQPSGFMRRQAGQTKPEKGDRQPFLITMPKPSRSRLYIHKAALPSASAKSDVTKILSDVILTR